MVDAVDQLHVERGDFHATSSRCRARGAPDRIGHEVVAKDRHTRLADGPDRVLVVLDLLVGALETEHRLEEKLRRRVLDRLERQPELVRLVDQAADILGLPALLARQDRRVHLDRRYPELRREAQDLVRHHVELAKTNAYFRCTH